MDYKTKYIKSNRVLFPLLISLLLIGLGCLERAKPEKDIFYVELINFNDSLGNYISSNSFGKAVFYKDNKLQILSENFVGENYPEMHYLNGISAAERDIKNGVKKIRVEFIGNYSVDSIRYSLQKYSYADNQWKKVSDLGVLKAVTTYRKAKLFSVNEFGSQIVAAIAEYSFQ